MLVAVYKTKEEIPAGLEAHYVERNGQFELQVQGMKTEADVERVSRALEAERSAHKATKDSLKEYENLGTLEELQSVSDEIGELRVRAGDGKDGEEKITKIVEARVARENAAKDRELRKLKEENEGLKAQTTELTTTLNNGKIDATLRDAATKAGVVPTAIDDILLLGRNMFEIAEDGRVQTRDGVGVTPMVDAEVFLSDMKDRRPHWFPQSQGGGSQGGKGNQYANNPFAKDNWNVTKQAEMVRADPVKAEAMAKAAGVAIGATKPAGA